MRYAPSVQVTAGTMAGIARSMGHSNKAEVEIIIDNHAEEKVYTNYDSITGHVKITASQNARFDEIRITFEGVTRTFVENLSPHTTKAKTYATHNFLRLQMPVRESDYPVPRIAEAGRTYTFPFNFAIPEKLLPKACSHECSSDHVHQAHLNLPPSLGDREISIYDDMTPEMSKVTYAIKARVTKYQERDNRIVTLVEGLKKLRVAPAIAEAPPMSVDRDYDDYVLSKTKTLRKGVFSGKLGRITASVNQTRAIMLPLPTSDNIVPLPETTMATMKLRFDPQDDSSKPPKLNGLRTRLRVTTHFLVRPIHDFPTRLTLQSASEASRGVYDVKLPVSSRCVEAVVWEKQIKSSGTERRNSDSSVTSTDDSDNPATSEPGKTKIYYTANVLIPINLPSGKRFVPSFQSCVVARDYTLEMTLSIHTPGAVVPASSVALRVPVQITAMGNLSGFAELTPAEAAAELADANEFFRPRIIEMPREDFIATSTLSSELPPSYEFSPRPRQVSSR